MLLNKLSDFDYDLPEELIAKFPLAKRTSSRLLRVDRSSGYMVAGIFTDILEFFQSGDVLVRNNTQVVPARLFGKKLTGGKVECLIERVIGSYSALVHIRASKAPKPGTELILADCIGCHVIKRVDDLFLLEFDSSKHVFEWLEQYGHMPLPPYIKREDQLSDRRTYQTVYADPKGAVAAPTAGLHFDEALFDALAKKGVVIVDVTLHVGAGTFMPVRVEALDQHKMHQEWVEVSQEAADMINQAKAAGGRICAVGTTSVRCLETAAQPSGRLVAYQGETELFIRPTEPPYQFRSVDALITNFHLPQSTLLMLVAAFIGYDLMRAVYQHAIDQQFRFFSYGDAMLLY